MPGAHSRPNHGLEGFEWLPDAYARDVVPHGHTARELVRNALAEGKVEALLRDKHGQRVPVAGRMWDKEPLNQKVYPRFADGRMRMRLRPYAGPYIEGWIFVPNGSLKEFLDEQHPKHTSSDQSENDKSLGRRIEAVLNEAAKLQRNLTSHRSIANAMVKTKRGRQFEGFSLSAIRKILSGTYPPATRRRFDGLDTWTMSKNKRVST